MNQILPIPAQQPDDLICSFPVIPMAGRSCFPSWDLRSCPILGENMKVGFTKSARCFSTQTVAWAWPDFRYASIVRLRSPCLFLKACLHDYMLSKMARTADKEGSWGDPDFSRARP